VRSGQAVVAKKLLGMGLMEGRESATSLLEMAAQKEKPGVMAPSIARNRQESEGGKTAEAQNGDPTSSDGRSEVKKQEHRLLETLRGEHDPRGGGEGGHRLPLTLRPKTGENAHTRHLTVAATGGHPSHGRVRESHPESEESSGGWSTASVSESESSNEYDSD